MNCDECARLDRVEIFYIKKGEEEIFVLLTIKEEDISGTRIIVELIW